MSEENQKKINIGLISFLSIVIVALAIWGGVSYMQSQKYKLQLENTYLKAISETSTNMSNLSSDFVKGLYAGTPTQMSAISSKVWKESSAAKAALSALPVSSLDLDNTYKFLSQVGDYAMYLSRKSVSGEKITPDERQQFLRLREYADRFSEQVDDMQERLSNRELTIDELTAVKALEEISDNLEDGIEDIEDTVDDAKNSINNTVKAAENATKDSADSMIAGAGQGSPPTIVQTSAPQSDKNQPEDPAVQSPDTGSNSFESIEKGLTGYPSLIYDGPFSDHILDKKPEMTKGQTEISKQDALAKAAKIAEVDAASLNNSREENSSLSSYVFYNDELSVAITKNGGMLNYLIKVKPDTINMVISKEDAIKSAQEYLKKQGIESMKETYYEITDGVMTINFAHYESERQIICYTDLIKVEVSMADGNIIGCDARGYLVNHKSRTFEDAALTKEEAQKSLSENLIVENVKLALIPSSGQNEVYVYEFLCNSTTGDKVLVYVNTETAVEEQILILLETPNGVLTK